LQKLQADAHFLNHAQSGVLVTGLCGSLNPRYALGEIVLYQNCVYQVNATTPLIQTCDSALTALFYSSLQEKVSLVKALTSDRIIWSAAEKRHLSEQSGTDVVDMEGFAVLECLSQAGVAIAMLRVISDDCQHDIPDLNSSVSPDGSLQPLSLASRMLRQPLAATRLIRGSLKGLKVLQEITTTLFSSGMRN
jgi:nucleoside phosphorylase